MNYGRSLIVTYTKKQIEPVVQIIAGKDENQPNSFMAISPRLTLSVDAT